MAEAPIKPGEHRIDGFSPNLNKQLHVGHLRNFCVALSLDRMLGDANTPVAMLGASVGMEEEAMNQLSALFHAHNYQPQVYLDLELPAPTLDLKPGTEDKEGCLVYGDAEVVVVRSNGKPTYAYHDLAFAQAVSPTHYVTGSEQKEHFKSLGLGEKHLPMGLVLGNDGKKIKSRSGEALLLTEAVQMVVDDLSDTQCDPSQLAWNIVCANMLMAARTTNVKFEADAWVNPNSPGMYITYTYARLASALQDAQGDSLAVQESDVPLLAQCAYFTPAYNKAVVTLDPAPIAHYALELAQAATSFYHQKKL
jgi:arginyl-tRNA synthetase